MNRAFSSRWRESQEQQQLCHYFNRVKGYDAGKNLIIQAHVTVAATHRCQITPDWGPLCFGTEQELLIKMGVIALGWCVSKKTCWQWGRCLLHLKSQRPLRWLYAVAALQKKAASIEPSSSYIIIARILMFAHLHVVFPEKLCKSHYHK